MSDDNRNLMLAMVLSFVVFGIWFYLAPPPEQVVDDPSAPVAETTITPEVAATTGNAETATTSPTASALAEAPRLAVETDRVSGTISLLGGRIDDLQLKGYLTTLDEGAPNVTLLQPENKSNAYYALHGWAAAGGVAPDQVPGPKTLWSVQGNETLTPSTPVTLIWDNGAGLTFAREISIDADYMFNVTQSVTNNGDSAVSMAPYGIIARHGLPDDLKSFFILHEGLVRMSDGKLDETDYDDMQDYDPDARTGTVTAPIDVAENGWIGFTDHYWMTTLIPSPGSAFKSVARYHAARDVYQSEIIQETQTIAPGQTVSVQSGLFAGAKEWATIRAYMNEGGVEGFLDSIDWGWFYFLTKPIFAVLHWLNSIIGNMGWSIIGLTLIIKLILLPLAYKSYVSMARMKELQPEMEKLKEKAGEDRQKLQQGMMELYKKNKVNPASGCLPILLQIPIFFSLYKVIFVTLELRHAPFFGPWQDLSAPDPTSIINLFGLLPFSGPEPGSILALLLIGILPLLMGISMWMQQKLNPAPTDATQAMIFAWMPWVFMFMLGSFASGLIIYWIANNTITFIQQYSIMASQGVRPDVFGNIISSFKRKPKDE